MWRLAALLVVVLVAGGCGDDAGSSSAATTTPPPSIEAPATGRSVAMLTGQSLAVQVRADLDEALAGSPVTMIASAESGRRYEAIKKGTSVYEQLLEPLRDGDHVIAVHVVHGEANMRVGTSADEYADIVVEWQADLSADIQARTGQTDTAPMLLSQTNSWPHYDLSTPTVGLGQLAAARTDPAVVMVGPTYQFGYFDGVHLTPDGYEHLAELHRRALATTAAGGDWQPLVPDEVTWDGGRVTARFDAPTPLVIDTDTVPEQPSMGFSLVDDSGAAVAIDSVSLGDDDTTVELDIDDGAQPVALRYGFDTAFGNLRDAADDDPKLANWAPHFVAPVAAAS